ncbi:MAG TPA: hypothetical protein VIV14_00785 [Gammaproteobacteria bacterium]
MAIAKWVWKETAEVLGIIGVIASMIFVGLEIRQNTSTVRGATLQAVSQQSFYSGDFQEVVERKFLPLSGSRVERVE